LFFGHTCASGNLNGLLGGSRLRGGRCLGHGNRSFRGRLALLCLCGFSGGFRRPPFFGHSRVGGNSNGLLGGTQLTGGRCFCGGDRSFRHGDGRFRGGASFLGLRGFGERVRGALFFGHSRVGGNSNGLLGGTLQGGSPFSRRGDSSFGGGATLLRFRSFGGRFRGALFFGHSHVVGGSSRLLELLGGSLGIHRFGLGLGPSRFGGGATLLGFGCFGSGFCSALFYGHPRVVGGSRGLLGGMLLSGGLCFCRGDGSFRRGAALFRLCCFGDGFRGALFLDDSRVGSGSCHLFEGSVCIHGFGLGLGASRFSDGATLLSLRGFSGGFRDALFLGHTRVGGRSRGLLNLLDDSTRFHSLGFGFGFGRFGRDDGGFGSVAALFSLRGLGAGLRGALFFGCSRLGGRAGGLLDLLAGAARVRRFGFGLGPRCFRAGNGGFRRGAALLSFGGFGTGLRGALFFGYSRVGGRAGGLLDLLDGSTRVYRLDLGLGPSGFRGGAALLSLRGFGGGTRSALFFRQSRIGGGTCGLFDSSLRVRRPGFGFGSSRFGGGAASLSLRGFGGGFRGSLFLHDAPFGRNPGGFDSRRPPLIYRLYFNRPIFDGRCGCVWQRVRLQR
jgi:hypothetical protein